MNARYENDDIENEQLEMFKSNVAVERVLRAASVILKVPVDTLRTAKAALDDAYRIKEALGLALGMLIKHEPPDSRFVSDEFVAMAAVECGLGDEKCMEIIRAAVERLRQEADAPSLPVSSDDPMLVVPAPQDWAYTPNEDNAVMVYFDTTEKAEKFIDVVRNSMIGDGHEKR